MKYLQNKFIGVHTNQPPYTSSYEPNQLIYKLISFNKQAQIQGYHSL